MKDIWEFNDYGKRNLICYTSESIRHPAKMELSLCREIIKRYSKLGDTILDPMAGIGTTIIEGMLLGRNVIGIECEQEIMNILNDIDREVPKDIAKEDELYHQTVKCPKCGHEWEKKKET